MNFIANGLLFLSLLLTGALFLVSADIGGLAGPDRGGAEIQFIMVAAPRWLFMTVVLSTLVARGAFGWIHAARELQWIAVLGTHAVAGAVSLLALMMSGDRSMNPIVTRYGWGIFSVAVPMVVIAYAAVLLNPGLAAAGVVRLVRTAAVGAMALSIAVGAVALVVWMQQSAAESRASALATAQQEMAEVDQVAPDAPLERYFDFVLSEKPDAIKKRAIENMQARPDYVTGLSELLRGPRAQTAMNFLRYGLDPVPNVFAEPAREAVLRNAEIIRARAASRGELEESAFDFECMQSIDVIEKLRASGVDFVPAVKELKAAMDSVKDRRIGARGRAEVDRWLKAHAR